jgi:hypothetical protein
MRGTTNDLLKRLEAGKRIVKRLEPRETGTRRELLRLRRNICTFYEWVDDLTRECGGGAQSAAARLTDGTYITLDPPNIKEHWDWLLEGIQVGVEQAIPIEPAGDWLAEPWRWRTDVDLARTTWAKREVLYCLNRMRVLAVRGEAYSSMLTLDELSRDLRANGICLDGGRS